MKGKDFCTSAKNGWELINRQGVKFGVSMGMFGLVSLGAIVGLTVSITVIGFLLVLLTPLGDESSISLSVAIIFVLAFFISILFMSVWSIIAETLVHCFCVDVDVNNDNPRYAPPILKEAL